MSSDLAVTEFTKLSNLSDDATDDFCALQFTEVFPITSNACTAECRNVDWSPEVKRENMPVVKQEPNEV